MTGRSLADGLGLSGGGDDDFVVLRDGRAGLDYLRSRRDLTEHGLYLELKAYETQAYLELRDVRDTDGRWRRLAEQIGGRGVPSMDEALRDLDLAPLHDALRRDDRVAAVRETAVLLGIAAPEPAADTKKKPVVSGVADVVEELVAANRPELAKGAWIAEWRAERALPDADLTLIRLASPNRKLPELLADDRFRRAIGVNQHDGVTWFGHERFEHAVKFLGLPNAAQLTKAAAASGYRIDNLEKELAKLSGDKPKWASTRAAPPVTRPAAGTAGKANSTTPVKPNARAVKRTSADQLETTPPPVPDTRQSKTNGG